HSQRDDDEPQEQVHHGRHEEVRFERSLREREGSRQVEVLVIEEQEGGQPREGEDEYLTKREVRLPRREPAHHISPEEAIQGRGRVLLQRWDVSGGEIPLADLFRGIKNEKEGMKYISRVGTKGCESNGTIRQAKDPCDRLRHLLPGYRVLRVVLRK